MCKPRGKGNITINESIYNMKTIKRWAQPQPQSLFCSHWMKATIFVHRLHRSTTLEQWLFSYRPSNVQFSKDSVVVHNYSVISSLLFLCVTVLGNKQSISWANMSPTSSFFFFDGLNCVFLCGNRRTTRQYSRVLYIFFCIHLLLYLHYADGS